MRCATAAIIVIAAAMIDENRQAFRAVESAGSLEFCSTLFSARKEGLETHLQPLTYGKNVSFSVLEPCRLRAATGCNAVDRLDPRLVVFFKLHASRFQRRDFGRNIIHRPESRTGPRRAGAGGWIHEYP